jgi:hypothetical protein
MAKSTVIETPAALSYNTRDDNSTMVNPGMAPKLTSWEKEPSVLDLTTDLEAARPAHDNHVSRVKNWNDLRKVEGKAKPPVIKGHSQIQPKLIRRQAEWRYSALTEPFNSSKKLFDVKPSTFEDTDGARQNELVINWQFRTKLNRVRFIDDYVRANVDEGSAIVRLGWNRITKEVEEEVPVWEYLAPTSQEEVAQLEQYLQMRDQDPRGFNEKAPPEVMKAVEYFDETGQPTTVRQNGTEKVKVEKVIENRPLVQVMNPENVFFDPSCGGDLDRSTFVVVSFETSKAELEKEPKRYKNLKYVNWETASAATEPNHAPQSTDTNFNFKDTLRKRVVAYEYWGLWDVEGNGELVAIVATWIGNTMVRLELNPFPDKKPPFVVVNYMPVKRELMGEPDAELLEDNQKILGAVTRGMIDLLGRSANGQQGFAKGMLDALNRRRYDNGENYEFNPNMPPTMGMIEHKYPDIPQSGMLMAQMQNQEAEALTGVKAFSGGISGESFGDVAAGIRGVLDAASKREMAILRRLADGIVQIGRKICMMNAAFLSEEETIRITNEEFVTVRRDELQAEFDLEVDISTAEIDNSKAQDLAFMLQTMGNTVDFGLVKIILVEIARLKRMHFLAEQLLRFEPQVDPLTKALREAEVQRAQKEIEKLDSEIELNKARAYREHNMANKLDLDTTEQETGTKHARDMEKTGGQATANQQLEITKALVKSRKRPDGGETDPDIEAAVGWNELSKRMSDPRAKNRPGEMALVPSGSSGPVNTVIPNEMTGGPLMGDPALMSPPVDSMAPVS